MSMNEENIHITEDLLNRYLLQETSEEENLLVEKWLGLAPENRKRLQKQKMLWDMMAFAKQDVNKEWEVLKKKISARHTKEVPLKPESKHSRFKILAVAASLLFLLTLSIYLVFLYDSKPQLQLAESHDEVLHITLDDGTQIALNRHSTLEYPTYFKEKDRVVKLKGEAFFEVVPLPEKPFVVETYNLVVRVLGTSFYVRAYSEHKQEVYVKSGMVECLNKRTNEIIKLGAGEKLIITDDKSSRQEIESTDMNIFAWQTARLVFYNEKMSAIAAQINNAYGCHITLKGPIENCALTVSFEDLTLEGVLLVLQSILDLEISQVGHNIEIKGRGC